MNRILIAPDEIHPDGTVWLRDARAEHLKTFLHAEPGRKVKAGILNGEIGTAEVLTVTPDGVSLRPDCREAALAPWFDLVLAVPRPRAMKRLWAQVAAMGVRWIYLVNAEKVEKSYFSSHCLKPENYRPLLIDGLMQAGTTAIPEVTILQRLHALPDILAAASPHAPRLIAHPGMSARPTLPPSAEAGLPVLAVGPDGGWTDAECTFFFENGFQPFALGQRPLRTDTACIALIAVLQSLTEAG